MALVVCILKGVGGTFYIDFVIGCSTGASVGMGRSINLGRIEDPGECGNF